MLDLDALQVLLLIMRVRHHVPEVSGLEGILRSSRIGLLLCLSGGFVPALL